MARDFAQIKLTIWQDPDFKQLTAGQQLVYLMLSSQPTTNLAGVLDYLPGRLSRTSNGLTTAQLDDHIQALEAAEFVFLDRETDEILVRSFMRTSGAWQMPNTAKSIATTISQVISPGIQSVLLGEVERILAGRENEPKYEKSYVALEGVEVALKGRGITPWAKGSPNPCANPSAKGCPREGDGEGDGEIGDGEGYGVSPQTVTNRSNPTSETPTKNTYPEEFETFWNTYPSKQAKPRAFTAWKKAITRADQNTINTGAQSYRDDPNRDPSYTKHASTWLNEDGWNNPPLPARNQGQPQYMTAAERRKQEHYALYQRIRAEEENQANIIQGEIEE